jgi:hypothetical protein
MEWAIILQSLLEPVLMIVVPAVAGFAIKFFVMKIKESESKLDDRIGAIAVKMAEDVIEGSGQDKLNYATNWINKVTKGKVSKDFAEGLVRATYQQNKEEIKKLKNV